MNMELFSDEYRLVMRRCMKYLEVELAEIIIILAMIAKASIIHHSIYDFNDVPNESL